MASTAIVGYDGNYALTGTGAPNGLIRSWSLALSMVISEVSAFGDSFRKYKGGIFGGTGSFAGVPKYDAATHAPNAFSTNRRTGFTLTLTAATGCTYVGTALFQNYSLSSDKTGDATFTGDFTFSDTITETWDESP